MNEQLSQLFPWLENVTSIDFAIQIGVVVAAFLIAGIARRIILRWIDRAEAQIEARQLAERFPLLLGSLRILQGMLYPFLIWIISQIAVQILANLELGHDFLDWLVPFLGIWVLFLVLTGAVRAFASGDQVHVLNRQILRPLFLVIVVLQFLGLWDDFLQLTIRFTPDQFITIRSLFIAIVVTFLFFRLAQVVRTFLKDTFLPRAGLEPSLSQIIALIASYAISVTGVVTGLNIAGIDLGVLGFVVGGLSVGIGFGLQTLAVNFIGGFVLLFERSIGPGDKISVGGITGTVTDIGLRSTRIRTIDNVELIVPNGNLIDDIVMNYSSTDPKVRLHIEVAVHDDVDPRQVRELLLQAADHPDILADPAPDVLYTNFGEDGLEFALRVWITDLDKFPELSSDIRFTLWDAFTKNGIEPPKLDVLLAMDTPTLPVSLNNEG